ALLRSTCTLLPPPPPCPTPIYTLSLHDALPISAALIIAFVVLGRYFEARAHGKTREAISKLLEMGAKDATLLIDGQELLVSIDKSEEHTSELQSRFDLVCRLLLEKKKRQIKHRR